MKRALAFIVSIGIILLLTASAEFERPFDVDSKSMHLLEEMRQSKGEVIGTEGKGVVALRFDDYQNAFGKKVYPLLIERGMPSSMALISRFQTAHAWGRNTTWNDVRTWNRNGVEMWSHGTNHNDYSFNGYTGLYHQVVTSKSEIERQNIKVMGWVLPGVAPLTGNLPYNGLTRPQDYDSLEGKLIMQTYALSEAYTQPAHRKFPTNNYHGLNHYTVSEKTTLKASKKMIDYAIENKTGIELMCHAGNLDKPNNMTLAEFTELLDYIKQKWDADFIEILTPSGLCFANPNSSNRLTLTKNGSFEGLTIGNSGAWDSIGNWGNTTIETTKGKTGHSFLRLNNGAGETGVTQRITHIDQLGVAGEQVMFEGWFRSDGNEETTTVIKIEDLINPQSFQVTHSVVSSSTEWNRVRFSFGIPPTSKAILLSIYKTTGDSVDWDDISIKIV